MHLTCTCVTRFIVNSIGDNSTLRNVSSWFLNATWKKTEQCFFFLCANVGQIVSTMTDIQLTFYHTCRFLKQAEQEIHTSFRGSYVTTDTYQACDCFHLGEPNAAEL